VVTSPTVTVCELLKVPPDGVKVGVAVVPPLVELLLEHPATSPSIASVATSVMLSIPMRAAGCHPVIHEIRGTMPPFVANHFGVNPADVPSSGMAFGDQLDCKR
jgi:hypothetical protein